APILPLVPKAPPTPAAAAPPPPPPLPPPEEPEPEPEPEQRPDKGPGLVAARKPEEALPVSLLLVLDRSGSMSLEGKWKMATAVAEETAGLLAPSDRIGVVTFADDATVDVPMRTAGSVASLGLEVGVVPDGNTDIYRALET